MSRRTRRTGSGAGDRPAGGYGADFDDEGADFFEPPDGEPIEPLAGDPIDDEPPGTPAERAVANLGRLLLLGLLIALLAGAAGSEIGARPPVGDEATYTLQALSLAHDRDLASVADARIELKDGAVVGVNGPRAADVTAKVAGDKVTDDAPPAVEATAR